MQNFKFWIFGNFLKFVTLTSSCFTRDLMWITNMGSHGRWGVSQKASVLVVLVLISVQFGQIETSQLLTHWGRVTDICIIKLYHHWFSAWMVPSHYLNQCWNIVDWTPGNKLQCNFNKKFYIFIQENTIQNVILKMTAILSMLRHQGLNKMAAFS